MDRCYGWKSLPDGPIQEALALQDENCRLEFKDRTDRIIVQLMEQGNALRLLSSLPFFSLYPRFFLIAHGAR